MIFPYIATGPTIPPRPYLTVFLRNGSRTTNYVMALVDSGADHCIFPGDLALALGLDLAEAPIWSFAGTSGTLQEARLADISLGVLSVDQDSTISEVSVVVAFCIDFKFGSPLLGQNGFFSNFVTKFYRPHFLFDIEPWDPKKSRNALQA